MILLGLICLCKWWWLLWLLPFILGWLLGKAMNNYWRGRADELETLLASQRAKYNKLETELEDCQKSKVKANKGISSVTAAAVAASTHITKNTQPEKKQKGGAWLKLKSDNLQIIEGIGPKMNAVLKDNGVNSWEVLAGKSRDEIKTILDKYGDKYKIIEPGDWPRQARFAAEDNWEGLIKHQSDDGSPSKAKNILIKLGIMKANKT